MGRVGKIWLVTVFVFFVVGMGIVIQTFRPVRNVHMDDVMQVDGRVTNIKEGTGGDIVITLENDSHYYYINRGLTLGLTIAQLKNQILNKKATLHPIKRWTIFTPDENMGHISRVTIDDTIIFDEIISEKNE